MKLFLIVSVLFISVFIPTKTFAAYHFANFRGKPPIHIYGSASKTPVGITPAQVKKIYRLQKDGGSGTIAIIGAYDDKSIESDLADFNKQFALQPCTIKNGCFEKRINTYLVLVPFLQTPCAPRGFVLFQV